MKDSSRNLPSGPVVKLLCFHCSGDRFNPWLGNQQSTCLTMQPRKKKTFKNSFITVSFQHILDMLANTVKQSTKIKGILNEKEETVVSLHTDNNCIHKELEFLELILKISISFYIINIQKLT